MRITVPELLIAASAIGALFALSVWLWWCENRRQVEERRRQAKLMQTERAIAQQCAEQKASAR